MYEDSWYSFVPDFQSRRNNATQSHGHRRKESLLQQPNGTIPTSDTIEPLDALLEEKEVDSPSEPTLTRRAKSYSDFYDIVRGHLGKDAKKRRKKKRERTWESLGILDNRDGAMQEEDPLILDSFNDELLEASQREHLLYRDKLALTERHLDSLIEDTNGALDILASLAESFRAVEDQTTSFQAQCDDLLSEQRKFEKLAHDVGTELDYYDYLGTVTRRLNAPGASRLVDDDALAEMLMYLESCIVFMMNNPTYRDAETYLARYQALLTKALHLLEVGFTAHLERVSTEISNQIAATQSESARHALAYGRFEEMMLDSYSLIPNVQKVIHRAYDRLGNSVGSGPSSATYSNTADNMLRAYLAARDRNLRPLHQADTEAFKKEVKESSVETASRSFVKQCFERSHDEYTLLTRIFALEPQYSTDGASAFATLKLHRSDSVNAVNIAPVATNLQSAFASANDLEVVCNVVGWMTNEYLILDYDEDETPVALHRQELTARVLAEHLWPVTDALFEAEVAKSISRAPVVVDALKIGGPVVNGVAGSNAYPPVKRALELLVMFDQCMPKERCQRNSPVVFKIVKEAIQATQRAEARIRSGKLGTDPDLFMIKNLLILKNELLTLEIGDVRSQGGVAGGMQHFGQIWDALSMAQGWVGYFSSFIPGASLFSRGSPGPGIAGGPRPAAAAGGDKQHQQQQQQQQQSQDANEQLDDLLRQSIYAFTQRWGSLINDAKGKGGNKLGGNNVVKIERDLDELLQGAFSNQPEVVAKLKEAIEINAQAQGQKGSRISRV